MAHGTNLSIENCIRELILNSLGAEATAIAVRIDTSKRRIQVIDNGKGIAKNDLPCVGEAPMNENPKNFSSIEKNQRVTGKSLMNIRKFSTDLIIMSRDRYSRDTYGKFFSDEKTPVIRKIEERPSCGTTVTLYAPSDCHEWKMKFDTVRIRHLIVYLALVNKQVSFSVRDDTSQSILLRIGKRQKPGKLLKVICDRQLARNEVRRGKIEILGQMEIQIFWGVEWTDVRRVRKIFLNLRPVRCPVLKNSMTKIVRKSNDETSSSRKLFFILYIESPVTEYEFSLENGRWIVEFYQIDGIVDSIKKFVTCNFGMSKSSKLIAPKTIIPRTVIRPCGGVLGTKPKKSFLIKPTRRSFDYLRNLERKITDLKVRPEGKKSRIPGNCSVINYDIDDSSLRPKYQSPDNVMAVEERRYHDILDVSQISQRCLEKSQKYSNQDHDISQMDRKCRDRSQKRSSGMPRTSQNGRTHDTLPITNKNYDNHDISWISQKCMEKSQKNIEVSTASVEESSKILDDYVAIDECSQWSDWIYQADMGNDETGESVKPIIYQRFKFLPPHLHALLPRGNVKLVSRDSYENNSSKMNYRRQDIDVRSCRKLHFAFTLKLQSLKSMKVLNQVNREFIVALTKQDDKKLLVIIDQHAIHERIRYEDLLRTYNRNAKNQQILSVVLRRPILIPDLSPRCCDLLSIHRDLSIQYGLGVHRRDETTLKITSVPRWFLRKTFYTDQTILEMSVRKLLREIVESLSNDGVTKILPLTIHEAIASEACRGSIKFGDPLTLEQCDCLIACWKDTEAPNRCAHGRPSVVPLLELESYERSKKEISRGVGKEKTFSSILSV